MFELSKKQKALVLSGVMAGMLLSALTSTIVSTAMPRIIASLGGMEYLSWALTSYMLSSTISMPISGRLSDMFGRKPFYLAGIGIFLLGNILCGFSGSIWQFILFRALAGIGGGVMQANAMTIVADLFPPAQRGKYQGFIGAVFGLASLIGPVLGGYITDHWHWSWVFWINIPLGIFAIILLASVLPSAKTQKDYSNIDYGGALLLIATFIPMLISFTWAGGKFSWLSAPVLALLCFALVALFIFIRVERKVSEPIIPLSLFKNKVFNISIVTTFLMSIAMFGILMYMPMFIQGVMGRSAAASGLAVAPMMGGLIISSAISGQVVSRTGKYKKMAIAGFILMTLALILVSNMGTNTSTRTLIFNMVLFGTGLGIALPIFVVAVQSAFPHDQVGVVTAAVQFFRSIGGTLGVAVMGSLMNARFRSAVSEFIRTEVRNTIPPDRLHLLETPQALFSAGPQVQAELKMIPDFELFRNQLRIVLGEGFHQIFLTGIVVMSAALITSFFLKEIPLRKTNRPAAEQAGMEMMAEGLAVPGVVAPPRSEPDIYESTEPPSSREGRSHQRKTLVQPTPK